jgi:hypothetical protein
MVVSPEARERSRHAVKARNKAYYEKNKERENLRCKEYHLAARDLRLSVKAEWRDANRERENLKSVTRRRENIDKHLAYDKARRESRVDADYRKKYDEENRQRIKELSAQWARKNRAKKREGNARRRCLKLNATPPWADLEAIRSIYAQCVEISRQTGIPHEVDHIVPLKGKLVCGLHVPCNLQVIPQRLNRAKGNRMLKA